MLKSNAFFIWSGSQTSDSIPFRLTWDHLKRLWGNISLPIFGSLNTATWLQPIPVHLTAKQTTFQHSFVCSMKHHANDCSACFVDKKVMCHRICPTVSLPNSQEGNLHLLHLNNCGPYTIIDKASISLRKENRGPIQWYIFKKYHFVDLRV